jgi:hypothetical protein
MRRAIATIADLFDGFFLKFVGQSPRAHKLPSHAQGMGGVSVVRTFGADRGAISLGAGLVWPLMLGGELAVLQAPMLDGPPFEPFTRLDDGERMTPTHAAKKSYAIGITSRSPPCSRAIVLAATTRRRRKARPCM